MMHPLTFRILLVLQDAPAAGSTIVERLGELPEGAAPSLPTLYRCLREALEQGWADAAGGVEGEGPGRPRRLLDQRGSSSSA